MSIFSDYKVGALSDEEYRLECEKMDREDRYEREKLFYSQLEAEIESEETSEIEASEEGAVG